LSVSGLPWPPARSLRLGERDCFEYAWVTLIVVNFEIKAFTFDPGLGQGFNVQPALVRLIGSYCGPSQIPKYESEKLSNINSGLGQGVKDK